jgi:hypothetical protein
MAGIHIDVITAINEASAASSQLERSSGRRAARRSWAAWARCGSRCRLGNLLGSSVFRVCPYPPFRAAPRAPTRRRN